jgi:hypothetical protein
MSITQFPSDRRAFLREPVRLPSSLMVGSREFKCLVVDLAQGGALIEGPADVSEGDQVVLRMAGQRDITAHVVRTTMTGFALAFAGVVVLARSAAE